MAGYSTLSTIGVEVDDGVAWATIDNPPINLWDAAFSADLFRLVDAVEADDDVRVLVLASAHSEFFVAHATPSSTSTPMVDSAE